MNIKINNNVYGKFSERTLKDGTRGFSTPVNMTSTVNDSISFRQKNNNEKTLQQDKKQGSLLSKKNLEILGVVASAALGMAIIKIN